MTSTSFQSPHPACHGAFRKAREGDSPAASGMALQAPLVPSDVHRAEARRMKAFAGQRQFQAPVADDFSRGMLADGPSPGGGGKSLKRSGLIDSLTAWWHRKGWG